MRKVTILFFTALWMIFCHAAPAAANNANANTSTPPVVLTVTQQTITIDGKPAKIFSILQPDGIWGYLGIKGQRFKAIIENHTNEAIALDWYGLIVPNDQDGVPYITQKPIPSGGAAEYSFPLEQSGTYWLHSHYKLQEQGLLAAPLIVHDPAESGNDQVTMFLQDYSFENSKEKYLDLRQKLLQKQANIHLSVPNAANLDDDNNNTSAATPTELSMDAYLTNQRTLNNPDIEIVHPGDRVHLHIIDASANSNFFIDLGALSGTAIAVDGQPIEPLQDNKFQLAMGQRIDLLVTIPGPGEGAYPILAQAEGTASQTGLILATPHAAVPRLKEKANHAAGVLDYSQELKLRALHPLVPRNVDRYLTVNLDGNSLSYTWALNGSIWPMVTPLKVTRGDRVEMDIYNKTMQAFPVHLHGHDFEVTAIDGKEMTGAMRDTILVEPGSSVKVQFDADNPGIWLLRSEVPYYLGGGMMTVIDYNGFSMPIFNQKDEGLRTTANP